MDANGKATEEAPPREEREEREESAAPRRAGAGAALTRLAVVPPLLVVAWLAVSLPLLMAGEFQLGPALVLSVPAGGLALWLGLRGTSRAGDAPYGRPVSWWAFAGVAGVGVAFLALQIAMCAEQIIVRRDPASYAQFGAWLNDHGSLPVPEMRWAFGEDRALSYASPGFYEHDGAIVPQFMAGLPMILALGGWIGGTKAMLAMAPVLGACAVVAFGGLTARLVGPRWAPLGALALALTLPMQWVSRSTYSEAAALVLVLGGLILMHDVPRAGGPAARGRAFLAGLALGLTVLVRIDGLRDVLPVVVFAGLLMAAHRRVDRPSPLRAAGAWLAGGLAVGVAAGVVEGVVLSRPYLDAHSSSVVPLLTMTVVVVGATGLLVAALRRPSSVAGTRRIAARVRTSRLPELAAALTVLVMIAFAARPYVQTVTRVPRTAEDRLNASFIEAVQRANGMPVDGTRQYSEDALNWVAWYIGVPALLLATLGAALLARRLLRRRSAEWLLPYAVIAWTTVTTLARPAITPDHPWAARRLISIVVPGLLLLALWALAWAVRRVRRLGYGRRAGGFAAAAGALLLVAPAVATSGGLMFARTEQGEIAAVRGLCDRLGPGRSVVVVERATADRLLQAIRGMCGVPAARTAPGAGPADVWRVVGKVYDAGRRPVILGASAADVTPYGPATEALRVRTRQDERTLVEPPDGTWGFGMTAWMSEPARPG